MPQRDAPIKPDPNVLPADVTQLATQLQELPGNLAAVLLGQLGQAYAELSELLPEEQIPTSFKNLFDAIRQEQFGEVTAPLHTTMDKVMEGTRRRRRILALVQEALSQLRLDMKYLVFDLEATRRERDALQQGGDGDGGAVS